MIEKFDVKVVPSLIPTEEERADIIATLAIIEEDLLAKTARRNSG